jgi:hypothetical protein
MPIDWNLAPKPVNVLESLQALGQSQDRARLVQEREAQMQQQQAEKSRLLQFNQQLGATINPQTGAVDSTAARMAYLGAGDPQGAIKFGRDQQTDFAAGRKAQAEPFAMAAWDVLQHPPEQQGQAWDAYVDQFAQQHPETAQQIMQFKGQYSPELAKAFLAETGHLDDFMKDQKPEYRNVSYDDNVYDMRGVANGGQPKMIIQSSAGDQPVAATKTIGNTTYYQTPDGKWHDEPMGGQSGQPAGNFPPGG